MLDISINNPSSTTASVIGSTLKPVQVEDVVHTTFTVDTLFPGVFAPSYKKPE